MSSFALRYITALVVLVGLDALWLGLVAQAMFRQALGPLLLDAPRWSAAAVFYLLYALGVVVFAVQPALRTHSWLAALGYGALFGFLAYMTYDLTNLTTIRVWTLRLAATDMAWGALLTALAAAASLGVARMIAKDS
jgi:uncharacterized membrane protein